MLSREGLTFIMYWEDWRGYSSRCVGGMRLESPLGQECEDALALGRFPSAPKP